MVDNWSTCGLKTKRINKNTLRKNRSRCYFFHHNSLESNLSRHGQTQANNDLKKVKPSSRITTRCLPRCLLEQLKSHQTTKNFLAFMEEGDSLLCSQDILYWARRYEYTPCARTHKHTHTHTHTHYIALKSTLKLSFYTICCFAKAISYNLTKMLCEFIVFLIGVICIA